MKLGSENDTEMRIERSIEVEVIVSCSDMIEWENVVKHLPL